MRSIFDYPVLSLCGLVVLVIALGSALLTGKVLNIGELVGPMLLDRRHDAVGYWWRVVVIAAGLAFVVYVIADGHAV